MPHDSFDCCSSFMKCSDAWGCIHADHPLFANCTYRKKLEAGICFYGKNTNIFEPLKNGKLPDGFVPFQKPQAKVKKEPRPEVYITCYKVPFSVLIRSSNTWSYKLDSDSAVLIKDEFDSNNIPYKTSLELLEDLPGDEVDIDGPCNSRVVFKIKEKEFHILSFNSYLIQNWYAEKLNKSLLSKGFESRVELIGMYAHSKSHVNSITKDLSDVRPAKKEVIHNGPVQLTLFDLAEVTPTSFRR
ncbi:hypothetical protein [Ruminiclostridium papyrosolvens]|uniref:Uncharacterized protein n=1 Tax=Ruminiclostridium papyrosolvens C7 TaxID=1330534 RepID=U4R0E0_9FIRM|nr:hypothetical protein [Ruminiclostridium papyrosolvens]EPR10126.1 hypothetical protein L323_14905 [Ruminiclostridium papyrosolvens C7]